MNDRIIDILCLPYASFVSSVVIFLCLLYLFCPTCLLCFVFMCSGGENVRTIKHTLLFTYYNRPDYIKHSFTLSFIQLKRLRQNLLNFIDAYSAASIQIRHNILPPSPLPLPYLTPPSPLPHLRVFGSASRPCKGKKALWVH